MRSTLTSITVVALLAAGAVPAAARLDGPINVGPVAHHAKATGIQGRQFRHLGGDIAMPAKVTRAPAVVVSTPAADSGFDWTAAAIGAGLAAALLLTAAGVAAVRRQHPTTAR